MRALGVVGCAVAGAAAGGFVGVMLGDREGGDMNFAPLVDGMVGVIVGGFVGMVAGAVLFT